MQFVSNYSEDIHKMKYLTCFLKEVMRRHTPVPLTNRTSEEDLILDGYEVAASTMIDLGIYHIHNNPAVWDSPEVSIDVFQFILPASQIF